MERAIGDAAQQRPAAGAGPQRAEGRDAVDARGRRVRLLDPVVMHLFRRTQTIPADPLRAIACDIEAHWTRRHIVPVLVALLAAVLLAIGYINIGTRFSPGVKLVTSFNVVWPLYFIVFGWQQARKKARLRILPALLKHRRCAHCGYDIRGLDSEITDGATVCPECGCAWNLNDPAILTLPAPELPSIERQRWLMIAMLIGLVCFALFGVWRFLSY